MKAVVRGRGGHVVGAVTGLGSYYMDVSADVRLSETPAFYMALAAELEGFALDDSSFVYQDRNGRTANREVQAFRFTELQKLIEKFIKRADTYRLKRNK